jgi:LmbE family N-acetylglucosaminyl deacetylase
VIAPHPDDESLAVGGLLQRALGLGAAVHVLFVTDGENNPWAQRATEIRWRISRADRERWRERRRGEAIAALERLGVPRSAASFLAFPDQGLTRLLMSGEGTLVATLRERLERFRPTLLVSPSPDDLHPDHSALSLMARFARLGLVPPVRRPRTLHFIVHRPRRRVAHAAEWALLPTAAEMERKRAAILCHESQLRCRAGSLLSCADVPERFAPGGVPAAYRPDHVIASVGRTRGALTLRAVPRARPGAWGPIELLLLADRGETREAWTLRVASRSGTGAILRWRDRVPVAEAAVLRRDGIVSVDLPFDLFAGSRSGWVKLERRHGFFDEGGWRRLPLRDPARLARAASDAGAAAHAPSGAARPAARIPSREPVRTDEPD